MGDLKIPRVQESKKTRVQEDKIPRVLVERPSTAVKLSEMWRTPLQRRQCIFPLWRAVLQNLNCVRYKTKILNLTAVIRQTKKMAINKVPPTKTVLLDYQKQLTLAEEGYNLLDRKREVLLNELMRYIHRLKEVQKSAYADFVNSLENFRNAYFKMSQEQIRDVLDFEPQKPKVRSTYRSVMGVAVPEIVHSEIYPQKKPSLDDSIADIEEVHQQMSQSVLNLIEYANIYNAIMKLANEINKTRKRVNALENIFIPDYNDTISWVKNVLEENEREEFFRQKMVKRVMRRA